MYSSKLPNRIYSDRSLDKLWWSCSDCRIKNLETVLAAWIRTRNTHVSFPRSGPIFLLLLLFQITSVACFTSLLSAGTAKISVSALPHIPKLRLLVIVSVFSAMFSLLVVFLNISHLHALLPMDYGKMVSIFS